MARVTRKDRASSVHTNSGEKAVTSRVSSVRNITVAMQYITIRWYRKNE